MKTKHTIRPLSSSLFLLYIGNEAAIEMPLTYCAATQNSNFKQPSQNRQNLLGMYPLSSKATSIAAVSAVLVGYLLVGAAAQGIQEGEIRPLMTEMGRNMRKWCVPKKSAGSSKEVGGRR